MLLGATFSWAGLQPPGVEFGIAMSCWPACWSLPWRGYRGAGRCRRMIFHGHAHGGEMPHGVSGALAYLVGLSE
ncbi:hypothetical protein DSL92_08355 [Billgrantia gudaonensis]|uniref:Uncharacterized protein n=1 Tax=Billgrantia gudaonensis TaxID=376427 RepID=A0A432JGC7_9GAMM|nr:hypothetical protein DSL92_08355 [Halomonas gudaonensis]